MSDNRVSHATYGICGACGQPMTPDNSCTANPANRIPWGSESFLTEDCSWNCNDCGVAPGGLHHRYCDAEECPICHGQALSCEHARTKGI